MTVPKCDNVRGIGVEHFFVAAEPCRLAVGFPVGLEYFDLETALTSTILGPLIPASSTADDDGGGLVQRVYVLVNEREGREISRTADDDAPAHSQFSSAVSRSARNRIRCPLATLRSRSLRTTCSPSSSIRWEYSSATPRTKRASPLPIVSFRNRSEKTGYGSGNSRHGNFSPFSPVRCSLVSESASTPINGSPLASILITNSPVPTRRLRAWKLPTRGP